MPILKKASVVEPIPPRYTVGRAIPKSKRRATFNPDLNTYSRQRMSGKHSGEYLWEQGIGITSAVPVPYTRAFSKAFSSAFS